MGVIFEKVAESLLLVLDRSLGGGEAGDLLLNITVTAKPGWERKEMDVYSTVRIPFTTAVFGGEALVSTLYGNVLCRIAAGTQSGTKIKLKGKGIVSMKNPSIHGNQYVTVQIDVPNPNQVINKGIDKEKVGQFAAEVRAKRPPEPYKGKGIKYDYEHIRRKEGKTGAK